MTSALSVVAHARGWVGTRFHHQGRLKQTAAHRGGVDCLGLLVGVAKELGLALPCGRPVASLDETDYPHYPNPEHFRNRLSLALREIPSGGIVPGDILLLNVDGNPRHLAIVSDLHGALGMIHAYAPARAVVEHALDDSWRARIVSAYLI